MTKSGQAIFITACLLLLSFTTSTAKADHSAGRSATSVGGRPRAIESNGSRDPLLKFVHEYCESLISDMQRSQALMPQQASFGGSSVQDFEFEVAMNLKNENPDRQQLFAQRCAKKVKAGNLEPARRISAEQAANRSYPGNMRRAFSFINEAL